MQDIIHTNNPFVTFFKTCHERLLQHERAGQRDDLKLLIRSDPSVLPTAGGVIDPRYAIPQASEVAIIADSIEKRRDRP